MLLLNSFTSLLVTISTLLFSHVSAATTVPNTVLIFARTSAEAYSATSGFNGHGIPYQLVLVPQAGITLPTLNSSSTQGNYGGIVVLSEVAYGYDSGWSSALTTAQWTTMFNYQTTFGVRMVRIDVYPTPEFGTITAIDSTGCCNAGVEQLAYITNATAFKTANLNTGISAAMTTESMWHYPANITDTSIATEIAQFAPDSSGQFTYPTTAGLINKYPDGRTQMVWFMSWATDWSPTSNFFQHAYINWITRGLYVGRRRIFFNTQVDDMHLYTALYQQDNATFRSRPEDMAAHATWQQALNTRLPSGSSYKIEIGHNGNGDIELVTSTGNVAACDNWNQAINYDDPGETALEFQKPLGSGTNLWPTKPASYVWNSACALNDTLAKWFSVAANANNFFHVSHTFTHENLDNATYFDANREIVFNVAWLKQMGLYKSPNFSPNGLIPPALTGLHNGDVIQAWQANNITNVVGDNTRPVLLSTQNEYYPLISNVSSNGYAGEVIMPRWSTIMYYNCDLPDCTLQEWIDTSAGSGDFNNLLLNVKTTNSRALLALRHDSYMFHQANMRNIDVPAKIIGTQSVNSLLQMWVETVTQEMSRLTTWPIISIKHDDQATQFLNRMTLDACNPNINYIYSKDGQTITGVTVTANKNTCGTPIPVTFPGSATTTASKITKEQIGSDPLTIWTTLSGSPVTFTLSPPLPV